MPHTKFLGVILWRRIGLTWFGIGDAATLEAAQVPMEVVHKKRELLAKIMKSKGLKRLKEILKQFIHDIYEK